MNVSTEVGGHLSINAKGAPRLKCSEGFSLGLSLEIGSEQPQAAGGGGPGPTDVVAGGVPVEAGGVQVAASS